MKDIYLKKLADRIKSACADITMEKMVCSQGYFHGVDFASRTRDQEFEFLKVSTEQIILGSWKAEMFRNIQGGDVVAAINAGKDFRLLVDENMANGTRLNKAYTQGFIFGAFDTTHGCVGDPELFDL